MKLKIFHVDCPPPLRREARDLIHVLSPLHPLVSNATFRYYIPASTFVKNAVLLRCREKKKTNRKIPRLAKSPPNLASFTLALGPIPSTK